MTLSLLETCHDHNCFLGLCKKLTPTTQEMVFTQSHPKTTDFSSVPGRLACLTTQLSRARHRPSIRPHRLNRRRLERVVRFRCANYSSHGKFGNAFRLATYRDSLYGCADFMASYISTERAHPISFIASSLD